MVDEGVVVVGGGPVGLWLACELRLAGVPVTVLEQLERRSPYTKALGVQARTLETLAMRGLAEPVVRAGIQVPTWHFGMLTSRLDFSRLDSEFRFFLAYPQAGLEELLENRALALGARIVRGCRVVGVEQDSQQVRVRVSGPDGESERRGRFVVGCDGAGSTVRRAAGIEFPGTDSTMFGYVADVRLDEPPSRPGFALNNARGSMIIGPAPGGLFRLGGLDPADQVPGAELSLDRLRASVTRVAGTDFGLRDPVWMSRFGNAARQAASYRRGRVLLAGDAAHMTFPTGGVGLNVGVQDAMNLGWKLAAELTGAAPAGLLDSYHTERHPVGQELLRSTLAQTALLATFTPEGLALRDLMAELILAHPELMDHLVGMVSGVDVGYPSAVPDAHPLTGRRAPNVTVGRSRLFDLLGEGRPVLLDLGRGLTSAVGAAAAVGIRTHPGTVTDDLPDAGVVLVRPDGYVWWAARSPSDDEVGEAVHTLLRPTAGP